jgi:hypothetical protein
MSSSDNDTDKMFQPSDGVPLEIMDQDETWPQMTTILFQVEESQIEEIEFIHDDIDISDGVPLQRAELAETEPSLPTTVRVRKSNPHLSN